MNPNDPLFDLDKNEQDFANDKLKALKEAFDRAHQNLDEAFQKAKGDLFASLTKLGLPKPQEPKA